LGGIGQLGVRRHLVTSFRVGDVMTREVVSLPEGTTLDEAARAMRDADIR